ncbi:MAG TPA: histidine kinase dimerization/phospho-acceptor domain-containing protein, partial [Vicinamibacterales bacterium]|nr:histidine kinase dimerization/phospho-acceptor domain-containing protein [Vicinamibacterales bacterium]
MLGSLTNRIFLATALLAVLSIATAVLVVSVTVTREAERGLQRGLEEAAALVTEWQATLSENFQLAARLIADAPPLKAAVATGDPATVAPLARDYHGRIRSAVLIVTDRQGRVLAETGTWFPGRDHDAARAEEAVTGREVTSYWRHPQGVLQLVTVPISAPPEVIGTLSVGFLFDRDRASQVRRLTESEVVFVVGGEVSAGTLPASSLPAVAALLEGSDTSRVTIDDEEFVALVRPLLLPGTAAPARLAAPGVGPAAAAGGSEAAAVVLQSRTDRLRFRKAIHAALAVTALLAILGAVGLSYLVARTITRPLAAITSRMREVAASGDLSRKIELPAGNREDEDARLLANTFNVLTDSIARFQREAAQKERLSSLGRMSTVIAHEIRNPLMIIKAALRPLRGGKASPPDVAEAARDIGEEVDRLNRIVTEVLDLARPIRFDLAEIDLAALCRQAAAAVTAGDPGATVALDVPAGPVPVVTDNERLRAVLVNLLSNARQAVLAARQPGLPAAARDAGAGREVVLALTPEDGRVSIEVRDCGTGMTPEEAARAFEPYFTTRQGGT